VRHYTAGFYGVAASPGVLWRDVVNRRVLGILSLGHFSVDIGAGGLPAILPFLKIEFGLSYFWLAALVMISGVTSSIMQPIFGIATDNLRTRFLLPLGVVMALGGFANVGVAPSYWVAASLVALAGVGSAMYHPEAAKSARTVSGPAPATANSVFAVGGNIGVAIGPPLVIGLIAWHGLHGTALLVWPAIAIALIVASIVPTVSLAHEVHAAGFASQPRAPWPKPINMLIVVTSLRSAVYSGVLTFVPLYAVNVLHEPATRNGTLLFTFLATGAVANLLAGPLADRFGAKNVMSISLGLAPLAFIGYMLSSGGIALVALALTGALIIGTLSTTVVMGMEYMPDRVGLASALLIGLSTGLGGLCVGALGGVADKFGLTMTLWVLIGIAVLSYGLTFVLPASGREPRIVREENFPADLRAR
jgi:MFS transporter, FSR family, fosmidomycin resistance protein